MNQTQKIPTEYLIKELDFVIQKAAKIKKILANKKPKKKPSSLYGMFKGLKISDKDIEDAKKSLFPYAYGKKEL